MPTKTIKPTEKDGWSAYSYFVLDKKGVCDQCHRMTHKEVKSYNPDELKKSLRGVLTSEVDKTKYAGQDYRGVFGEDSTHRYASEFTTDSRTYCRSCGSDKRAWMDGDLPLSMVLEFGENLYEHIEEIDALSVEKEILMDEIHRLKRSPDMQGDDHYIFHKAMDNVVGVDHEEIHD